MYCSTPFPRIVCSNHFFLFDYRNPHICPHKDNLRHKIDYCLTICFKCIIKGYINIIGSHASIYIYIFNTQQFKFIISYWIRPCFKICIWKIIAFISLFLFILIRCYALCYGNVIHSTNSVCLLNIANVFHISLK